MSHFDEIIRQAAAFNRTVEIPKPVIYADTTFDRLTQEIEDFQTGLKPDEEVGAMLASFGQTFTIHVEDIGFRNPFLITITGTTDKGDRCQLVQHMSQLNMLLLALPAPKGREARRIGFHSDEEQPEEDSE